jgi:hypothetical protein
LELSLLEGRILLSSATGHHSAPQVIPCFGKHLLNLDGRIGGNLTSVGSSLQIVSSTGSVQDYGRVNATGAFTLTPAGMISSGQIVLHSPHGRLSLTLVENERSPVGRNGQFNLRYTVGHGTNHYSGHCSSGSVRVALDANRSNFVATVGTVTTPPPSPPRTIPCLTKHLLNLDGRIEGSLKPAGSTLQMVSTTGSLQDYGRVTATGTITLTPTGMIISGRIFLNSRRGSVNLTLVKNQLFRVGRNGQSNLRFTTGRGTGDYAGHCSLGSVLISLDANRSNFVATLRTTG